MKYTLIICPMSEEFDELKAKIEKYKETAYGNISGIEFNSKAGKCFAFIGKIGKTNIGFDIGYLSNQLKIGRIFNVGVAGSLKAEIVPLSVVIATKVCYYDADLTAGGKYVIGQMAGEELYYETDKKILKLIDQVNTTVTIYKGTIISGDSFATSKNMSAALLTHFDDPLCVDMESGAVGQAARRLGVPFTVIRAISDNVFAEGDNSAIFNEFLSLSARRAASVLMHILNNEVVDEEEQKEDIKPELAEETKKA